MSKQVTALLLGQSGDLIRYNFLDNLSSFLEKLLWALNAPLIVSFDKSQVDAQVVEA